MASPPHFISISLFEELRGERVVVRPYRMEDAAELQAAVAESRSHLLPWLPWAAQGHQTVDDSRETIARFMAQWLLREDMTVALFDAASGRLVGGGGLHPHDWQARVFEIGYWTRAGEQGKGYITEVTRLLTEFAARQLSANRVFIRCDARNTRSAAVPQRLGFLREALLRNEMYTYDGKLRDTLVFALVPGDPAWPA
ncbi:MAG TPA: GNAT family protein [Ktedonobacterales bacterium]